MSGTDLSFIYYTIPETWVPATLTQTHVMSLTYSLLAMHVHAGYKGLPVGILGGSTHNCCTKSVQRDYTLVCSLTAHLRARVWNAHWCAIKCVAQLHTRDESAVLWTRGEQKNLDND